MRQILLSLALAGVLLLPGCLEGGTVTTTNAAVKPQAFTTAGARAVTLVASTCTLCLHEGGFSTESDATPLFLFENDRVLLVEFNHRPGDRGFATDRRIPLAEAELKALLKDVPWTRGSALWVNRVTLGKLVDPTLRLDLVKAWTPAGVPEPCADCSPRHYRFSPSMGDVRVQDVTGALRASDPFIRFAAPLDIVEAGLRERGLAHGIPPGTGAGKGAGSA